MADEKVINQLKHKKESLQASIWFRLMEAERLKDSTIQADIDSWEKQISDIDKDIADEEAK